MKKSAAALATPVAQTPSAANGSRFNDQTSAAPPSGAALGSVAPDGHVHGPVPGQEPTADAVSLVEGKAMDTRHCLNCKQSGHALVRCGVATRDYKLLPCA
eukprot:1151542-Rhodomonas_salina.1